MTYWAALSAFPSQTNRRRTKSVEDVLVAPKCSWQDKVAKLPQFWPALNQDVEVLQMSSERASVLKRIPLFAGIPCIPAIIAPRTPGVDREEVAWAHQLHDAMPVLATAKILHEDEHGMNSLELQAPSAQSKFDVMFALLVSLSFAIEQSRQQAVNK